MNDGQLRCGVTLNDAEIDQPIGQIVDILRDAHYQLGFQEHQFPSYETMVVNINSLLEELFISLINNTSQSSISGLMEHVNDYYPQIYNYVNTAEIMNFLQQKFLLVVNFLLNNFRPALQYFDNMGYVPHVVEKFNINSNTSYYVLTAENGALV